MSMRMADSHQRFMQRAIEIARAELDSSNGGPFGAVVVREGEIVGEGCNRVTATNDPTAHAEIVAIRQACQHLAGFQLDGCTLYTTCEPCPMCLGAIYWARAVAVFYACTRDDAARADFDDKLIYEEMQTPFHRRRIPMTQLMRNAALSIFDEWLRKTDRVDY